MSFSLQESSLVERLDVTAEVAEGLPGHAPRAAVTLVAHFVNTSTVPVEGRFACPVDTQAAVGAVSLKVGERTTQAHAVSQDTADNTFDDAVAGGKRSLHVDGASLVSEGVLRLSVGLLPPGERVAATVTYLTDLALDHVDEAGGYVHRLVVPLVGDAAAPARTGSGAGAGAGASADVYDVSARVYACAGSAALLSSPTHNMAFAADSSTLFTPDRDLVVHCTVAHAAGGSASVAVSIDAAVPAAYRHAFALPVDVPGCVRAGGGKVAVLLDCGPEVSAAAVLDEGKRFCSAMVRALPEGTSVAVAGLGLGDMPPLRVLKDGGVREEVLGKVSRMKASGGGRLSAARLASALRGVVQTHGADTEVVVVMSGCTESSRGELQAAVSASGLTVHAVSVGHAAGRGLVEAVAQAGGGLFTHVALQEKVRRKADALVEGMQKALPAAASRCVTTSTPGVRLCVDGPLSGKRDNVVRGFAAEGVETVTLACAGLDWSHTFTLPPPRAAVLLRELHACVAAAALRTATPEDTHLIATAFDMPSAHTSLVATDTAVYTGSVAGFSTRSVEAPAAAAMRAPKAVGARVPSAQSDTRVHGTARPRSPPVRLLQSLSHVTETARYRAESEEDDDVLSQELAPEEPLAIADAAEPERDALYSAPLDEVVEELSLHLEGDTLEGKCDDDSALETLASMPMRSEDVLAVSPTPAAPSYGRLAAVPAPAAAPASGAAPKTAKSRKPKGEPLPKKKKKETKNDKKTVLEGVAKSAEQDSLQKSASSSGFKPVAKAMQWLMGSRGVASSAPAPSPSPTASAGAPSNSSAPAGDTPISSTSSPTTRSHKAGAKLAQRGSASKNGAAKAAPRPQAATPSPRTSSLCESMDAGERADMNVMAEVSEKQSLRRRASPSAPSPPPPPPAAAPSKKSAPLADHMSSSSRTAEAKFAQRKSATGKVPARAVPMPSAPQGSVSSVTSKASYESVGGGGGAVLEKYCEEDSFFAEESSRASASSVEGEEAVWRRPEMSLALQRLAASPTDAESYYALAQLLAKGQCVTLQTGEVMDRVQLLKRAIALAPEDAKLYRALGESIDGDSTVLESGVVCTKAALLAM